MRGGSAILSKRSIVYANAKAKNPKRWSRGIRDWTPVGDVALNPDQLDADRWEGAIPLLTYLEGCIQV